MNVKLSRLTALLNSQTDFLYEEGAFQLFLDNKISADELKELLEIGGITLPPSFYELPSGEQKRYYQHVKTVIDPESGQADSYYVFNAPYFYDLAYRARKSQVMTKRLVRYTWNVTENNIPLFFLMASYIKIANLKWEKYPQLLSFGKEHHADNLYALLMELFSFSAPIIKKKEVVEMQNLVLDLINRKDFLEMDLRDPFYHFALLSECVLYPLARKEANTLKIQFGILDISQLRNMDYNLNKKSSVHILKDYSEVFKPYSINKLKSWVSSHKKECLMFQPNGYTCLYYAFLEDDYDPSL